MASSWEHLADALKSNLLKLSVNWEFCFNTCGLVMMLQCRYLCNAVLWCCNAGLGDK